MKDSHLTLRLPADLARALARLARSRGVAKSQVVREAVARYVTPAPTASPRSVTGGDLAERWPSLPRLSEDEAASFEADLAAARRDLPPPGAPAWG